MEDGGEEEKGDSGEATGKELQKFPKSS